MHMKKLKLILLAAYTAVILIAVSCQDEELAQGQFLLSIAETDGGQDFYYDAQKRVVLIDMFSFFSEEKTITGRVELNYADDKLSEIIQKWTSGVSEETRITYDNASRISQVVSTHELLRFSYPSDKYIQVEVHSPEETKLVKIEKWYLGPDNEIVKTESQSMDTNGIETVEYTYTSSANLLGNLGLSSIEFELIYGSQVFLAQEVKRNVVNQAGEEISKSHYFYEPDVWKNGLPIGITERILDEANSLKVVDKYKLQWGGLVEE